MELAPEKLIEMLEKGESLPNVILMYGEGKLLPQQSRSLHKKICFLAARRMKIWK